MKNRLTKTDYLEYLRCPNEFWLRHNRPEILKKVENTLEYEHLRQQGYAVEAFVKQLGRFQPKESIAVDFQRVFQTSELYARSDAVITDKATGIIDIYEIKSSASVKPEHLDDVAFQKIVAERCGFTVGCCHVIVMNGEYVRRGDIDVEQLFTINDVTDQIGERIATTEQQIEAAMAYADSQPVPLLAEHCDEKLNCEFIKLHFPELPEYTVFNVSRLHKAKLRQLLESGVVDIVDIPDGFPLSPKQQIQVTAAKIRETVIDREKIAERRISVNHQQIIIRRSNVSIRHRSG